MADNTSSGANNAIVTIVALIVIAILAFFVIQMIQGQTAGDTDITIPDVDIGTTAGETGGVTE